MLLFFCLAFFAKRPSRRALCLLLCTPQCEPFVHGCPCTLPAVAGVQPLSFWSAAHCMVPSSRNSMWVTRESEAAAQHRALQSIACLC